MGVGTENILSDDYGGGGCELDYAAEGGGTSKEDGTRIQGTRNAKGIVFLFQKIIYRWLILQEK